jgi:hypothetical protein
MDAWDKNFECWHPKNTITSVGIFCELCGCNKPLENHELWCPNHLDRFAKDDPDFWYGLGTGPNQFWYDEEADVCDCCGCDDEEGLEEWTADLFDETEEDWTMRDKCLGIEEADPYQGHYTKGHPPQEPTSRNPAFEDLLNHMSDIHDRKNKDYAEEGNPYSNFEFAAKIGGCSVDTVFRTLIGVKLARLDELLKGKSAQFESITDSQLDLAVYAALWASYSKR